MRTTRTSDSAERVTSPTPPSRRMSLAFLTWPRMKENSIPRVVMSILWSSRTYDSTAMPSRPMRRAPMPPSTLSTTCLRCWLNKGFPLVERRPSYNTGERGLRARPDRRADLDAARGAALQRHVLEVVAFAAQRRFEAARQRRTVAPDDLHAPIAHVDRVVERI